MTLRFRTVIIMALWASLAAISCSKSASVNVNSRELESLCRDLPFEMKAPCLPCIPSRTLNLLDCGAVGDGITLNTEVFHGAIEELAAKGGGHLIVPGGIWRTGPVELKSCIDLHLEDNAVILFDPDFSLYPVVEVSFEGLDTRRCTSPVSARGAHDIAITGRGVIDGSGDAWRPLKKSKVTSAQWKQKVASGGVLNEKGDCWYPDEAYIEAERSADMNVPTGNLTDAEWNAMKSFLRPVMISLVDCERVLLEGPTFQNSPAWNIHPLLCKDLVVNNITVRNPSWSQNGDGIDIESCTGTVLMNSSFDCGDDGICIKSGKDADGRRRGIPCKDLVVENCVVYHGHGGFVVGSEMSGGVENVMVRGCRFLGTDVGLRFKSKRGRGGVVRDIWIEDINMTDIKTEALLFDLFYGGKSAVEALEDGDSQENGVFVPVPDETTPEFRDIHIRNIVCNGARRAMYFNGLPEKRVSGIGIDGCIISADRGIEISYSENVRIENAVIKTPEGVEPVKVTNSENVVVK
ncbi:MAG: glycoside hydrolase family 28 protein [Bacteroidales bacterium]|nr:glycoside hydrolase family 28 protein [Bacteroidales bacterium]